jgi:hypothetical protein
MLFLYALLYFALSNAIAAAPIDSNSERGLNPAAFTSLVAPSPVVQNTASQPPTRNIKEPGPVQKTRKPSSLAANFKTVDELELEEGRIYAITRQLVVSYDDHSRNFRNLTVYDRMDKNIL